MVATLVVTACTAQSAAPTAPLGTPATDGDTVPGARGGRRDDAGQVTEASATPDVAVLQVHLYVDGRVDAAIVSGARVAAQALLSAAGVPTRWRNGNAARVAGVPSTPLDIVTILRSGALGRGSGRACGYAAGSKHQVGGSIVVSVPCVAAFALGLSRSDFGWRHPRLAIPRHDDLVGAVIAHEIAHLLGVGHAASGVMRSGLHHDDVVALRAGKLAFERQEVMALRMGLAAASAPRTASRHP